MRLHAKVLGVAVPLALAAASASVFVSRWTAERVMVKELGQRMAPALDDAAGEVSAALRTRRSAAVKLSLRKAAELTGASFAEVLDGSGVVIAHTDAALVGSRRDTEPVRRAIAAAGVTALMSADKRDLMLAAPVWASPSSNDRLGTLRLGLSLGPTRDSAERVSVLVGATASAVCLVSLGLAFLLVSVLLSGVRELSEATRRVADGQYGYTVASRSRDEIGELAESFNRMSAALARTAVSRDRLEEALAVSRATLEASADGVLVIGRDLMVVTYNSRFLEMFHLPEETVRGAGANSVLDRVAPLVKDAESLRRHATPSYSDFETGERRDQIAMNDGRRYERISRPFRMGGRAVGRTITFRDLTMLLEGERALAQARDEAVESARRQAEFVATVSHELRTPLQAIVGAAALLRRAPLSSEQREHAEILSRAAEALLELVRGVLDFGKLEAGRAAPARQALRADALLEESVSLVAARASEKGLDLRVAVDPFATQELTGDPVRLRQVLLNLLSNAVRFTDHGSVSAGLRALGEDADGVELEFSVKDTGVGIREADAQKLFTPFVQAGGPGGSRGGAGLGLAISKHLVELMGGRIGFESAPGEGSRFWFRLRLPRAAAPRAPAAAPAPAAAFARRDRLNVLVAEDDETNRRLLARQLELLGCRPVLAADGRAAVEAAAREEFSLVLMDCRMPVLDGTAAAAEIRARERGRRRAAIVAFTANATPEDRRRCLEAGMDEILAKPVTLEDLAAALDRWDRPFDELVLESFLHTVAGAPGASERLIADFLSDVDERVAAAREALTGGDAKRLSQTCHALKGACAAVGARGLQRLAALLELSAERGADAAELAALLEQAEVEARRVREEASRR